MPDDKNNNLDIEMYISEAFKRYSPSFKVKRCAVDLAYAAIDSFKPHLALGVGSIVSDDADYSRLSYLCKKNSTFLAHWQLDDPYEFDFNWKLTNRCDWVFTTDKTSIDYYASSKVSHLPLAADISRHFRRIDGRPEPEFDVFFCGYAYANRLDLIRKLDPVLKNFQVFIAGQNWDESYNYCINKRIPGQDIAKYYSRSKFVLSVGRRHDLANRRLALVPSTPGPRVFEAAAAGAVQLCLLESIELLDYFQNETEILIFNSVDEFEKIANMLSQDSRRRAAISQAAQQKVRTSHTYDARIDALVRIVRGQGGEI